MKLAIVAATGGIGRQVLDQAVAAGHEVTAIVRDPSKLPHGVSVTTVDLARADTRQLERALSGADAVLSALGARGRSEAGVASQGTQAIVQAMQRDGTRRLVVVSAAPVGTVPSAARPHPPKHDPGDGFVMRHVMVPVVKATLGWVYADLARMEDIVRQSGLQWTVVRPPRLSNGELTGRYRTAYGRNVKRGLTISRADVAHLMLGALEEPESIGQTIGIAY